VTDPPTIATQRLRAGDDGTVTWIVRPCGELDITIREELAGVLLEKVADDGAHGVTVDLSETTFLDSEAMASLIEGYAAARRAGKTYRLVNGRGIVHRVLSVAGLLELSADPP
jgi:anti-anti-sigma factor